MRGLAGDWCYSLDHDEPCRIIAVDVVWGEETAQVWLARRDAVVRLHRSRLQPLAGAVAPSLDQLCYVASAARILDAMERDALIAPLEHLRPRLRTRRARSALPYKYQCAEPWVDDILLLRCKE